MNHMSQIIKQKRTLNIILASLGIGIIGFYTLCHDYCRYLQGDIWGIDLKYLGIFFMALLLTTIFLNMQALMLLLLSLALGGEIFLIGYQFEVGVFCPFCLAYGTVVILMFALNFDKKKIPLVGLSLVLGLVFFLLTFSGSFTPAFGAEKGDLTTFGSGPINVRLYTDYFCPPCRRAEPEIERLLAALLKQNRIRLTLIDTPIHPGDPTPLYAKYFLYLLQEKGGTFEAAFQARTILNEAAEKKIFTAPSLEAFLVEKRLQFHAADVKATFHAYNAYIKEDKIDSTPSCVIEGPAGKQTLLGGNAIITALKGLLTNR